ncbi:hypothetical protein [Taibaiella chishuiensis]|uniref:Uncharacterized protein n=1 Tax=Taibaiella chishuiensis TaxID=1434707 RepID=A0A2P8DCH1_9BACT|nr:hypothetical protein [Taibaiella chishuiensis]PSK94912.1 hypothetical protein B0I18_1011075 [Taibaiella chishuiensis]
MKKLQRYAGLAVLLLGPALFTSCKNEFQCTCTDAQGKVNITTIEGSSRAEAKTACESVTIAGETCVLN